MLVVGWIFSAFVPAVWRREHRMFEWSVFAEWFNQFCVGVQNVLNKNGNRFLRRIRNRILNFWMNMRSYAKEVIRVIINDGREGSTVSSFL